MNRIRWITALTCLALPVVPGGDAAAADLEPPRRPTGVSITLITGDRVRVTPRPDGHEQIAFEPAGGRSSAVVSRSEGRTTVIPTDVVGEVAAGRLDRSLFDITTLIAEGYDDAKSPVLPVIIRYAGSPATARVQARVDSIGGAASTRLLSSIGARAVAVRKAAGAAFWRSTTAGSGRRVDSTVKQVLLDRRVRPALDKSVPQIGAPAAWQRGLTGRGVKVAVLDTGIDASHPDLAGRIAAAADFSGSPDSGDHVGHGTHVAGVIAGNGAASGGRYRGVAPDALVLNGKVLDDSGSGTDSSIIAGMEWAVAQGAKIVNLSLGGGATDGRDPLSEALNTISRQSGALFVVAAGNCFEPDPQQISTPASADLALAVANLDRDGAAHWSSCRGPRAGDFSVKPEIAAPGSGIVSARAAGTGLGDPLDNRYTAATGTSMATPHVAGTAALLAQAEPSSTGTQLRNRLISTADPAPGSETDVVGSGRVDADQTTDGSISTETGVLNFGMVAWPHPEPEPATRTITYRNTGTAPITLELTASLDPGEQGPAPRFSTRQLVVPAGEQSAVAVTADLAAAGLGARAGRIMATPTGDGEPLVTPFAWYVEPERYDLIISGILRDGAPANAEVIVGRPDGGGASVSTVLRNGTSKLRVEPGVYDVSSTFIEEATDERPWRASVVAVAQFAVPGNRTVTLDARRARKVGTTVAERSDLFATGRYMVYTRTPTQPTTGWVAGVIADGTSDLFVTPTGTVTTGRLEFSTRDRLAVPPYRATVLGPDAPALPVLDLSHGPIFTGRRELVAVDSGAGSPDELADDRVRGKLAVIKCLGGDAAVDKAAAAERAGAAGVLFHNPERPGIDGVRDCWITEARIPVMRTTRVAAGNLLRLARERETVVRIVGVNPSPQVYDLARFWSRQVPESASYAAHQAELARGR